MFIFVVICPLIFALIYVSFCDIDDLKSYTKIMLRSDFIEQRKPKNPL